MEDRHVSPFEAIRKAEDLSTPEKSIQQLQRDEIQRNQAQLQPGLFEDEGQHEQE